MTGWVKLHRKILESHIFDNPDVFRLWCYLILSANHREVRIMIGLQTVHVLPGQMLTGRRKLAEKLKIKETTLERYLKVLESGQQIGQQTFKNFRLITITNWTEYQENGQEIGQQTDNARTTNGQRADTNKNEKNEKNEKKVSLDDLSVSHIADWLTAKRVNGKYLTHDEHAVLEQFKDYCKSKGKRYADYPAALRRAFDWDSCQPRGNPQAHGANGSRDNRSEGRKAIDISEQIIAKRNAEYAASNQGQSRGPESPDPFAISNLRAFEEIR